MLTVPSVQRSLLGALDYLYPSSAFPVSARFALPHIALSGEPLTSLIARKFSYYGDRDQLSSDSFSHQIWQQRKCLEVR